MPYDALIYKMAFASLRGINRTMAGELLSRTGGEQAFFELSEVHQTVKVLRLIVIRQPDGSQFSICNGLLHCLVCLHIIFRL